MNTEKQYTQAFNNGYLLFQYEPNISNILTKKLTPSNNYLRGFFAGREQLELENNKDQLFELQLLRNLSNNKENDIKREFD